MANRSRRCYRFCFFCSAARAAQENHKRKPSTTREIIHTWNACYIWARGYWRACTPGAVSCVRVLVFSYFVCSCSRIFSLLVFSCFHVVVCSCSCVFVSMFSCVRVSCVRAFVLSFCRFLLRRSANSTNNDQQWNQSGPRGWQEVPEKRKHPNDNIFVFIKKSEGSTAGRFTEVLLTK